LNISEMLKDTNIAYETAPTSDPLKDTKKQHIHRIPQIVFHTYLVHMKKNEQLVV